MEKEEILKQSQMENKFKDPVEREINDKGAMWGSIIAIILALVFYTFSICLGYKFESGYMAIITAMLTGLYWYRWIKLKKRNELAYAIIQTAATLIFTVTQIISLFANSPIL